jgi:mannose-6-phosphate isomerase
MFRLGGVRRDYSWGSTTALPELIGVEPDGRPFAELWFGAHGSGPSTITGAGDANDLRALVEAAPDRFLGADVHARFGPRLPYLLKLIAPDGPLSLQVHPDIERARAGFALENAAGIPVDASTRNYRDTNHKPELVYALTTFEAVSGFRAPRRAAELFEGLDTSLGRRILKALRRDPSALGVRAAFGALLDAEDGPTPYEIDELVAAVAARAGSSPSPRADAIVALLAEHFPGDPGIVVSLLLNPVTLRPGEAMFVPAGGVHAYLSGVGVELMANSDNVLRAALTSKHRDVPELLDVVEYVAAPPIRIAPELSHSATRVYYAPVDDFELSITDLDGGAECQVRGSGPRILLALDGDVELTSGEGQLVIGKGEAVFVPAYEGSVTARGVGTVVQADVP